MHGDVDLQLFEVNITRYNADPRPSLTSFISSILSLCMREYITRRVCVCVCVRAHVCVSVCVFYRTGFANFFRRHAFSCFARYFNYILESCFFQ